MLEAIFLLIRKNRSWEAHCWNCTHSWLNTVQEVQEELLQLSSGPYLLAASRSPSCLELERLGGAAAHLKSQTRSIMQCKVFLLLLYSIMGSVDLASEGSERFGPKTCFVSFRWHPLKEQLHISIAQVAQFERTFLFLAAEHSRITNKYSVTGTGRVVWWLLARGGVRLQLPVCASLAPQG